MAFLSSRDHLPLTTVTSAGAYAALSPLLGLAPDRLKTVNVTTAQCLYVLTDDNPPVGDEIRANLSYVSCLLEISKVRGVPDVKGKTPAAEERAVALGILGCGAQTLGGGLVRILATDWKAQVFCGISRHSRHPRPSPLSTSIRKSFCPCCFRPSLLCPCKKQRTPFGGSFNCRHVMRRPSIPSDLQ